MGPLGHVRQDIFCTMGGERFKDEVLQSAVRLIEVHNSCVAVLRADNSRLKQELLKFSSDDLVHDQHRCKDNGYVPIVNAAAAAEIASNFGQRVLVEHESMLRLWDEQESSMCAESGTAFAADEVLDEFWITNPSGDEAAVPI